MAVLDKCAKKIHEHFFVLFRIIIGFFFAMHGIQKIGWITGQGMSGFMLFIGWCEFLIGLGIFFGVLTRIAALGGVIIMIGAIIKAHTPTTWATFMKGEMAWLYLAAFLVIFAHGAVNCSIEKFFLKKELV